MFAADITHSVSSARFSVSLRVMQTYENDLLHQISNNRRN